uniref:Uncharacterized protein n=1 Tax=Arundo donax TaxID=35708 RepID=A0A0A9FR90_ARUDO
MYLKFNSIHKKRILQPSYLVNIRTA